LQRSGETDTVASLILKAIGVYKEGELSLSAGYLYTSFMYNISNRYTANEGVLKLVFRFHKIKLFFAAHFRQPR